MTFQEIDRFAVRVKEWDCDSVIMVTHNNRIDQGRVLLLVATDPKEQANRVLDIINRLGREVDWHWKFQSQPIPGIYASLGFSQSHHNSERESPQELISRLSGLSIEKTGEI